MTQGQWQRSAATLKNPSKHGVGFGKDDPRIKNPVDLRHPVEHVSWAMCMATMDRMGLALPTEEQWEYAARAGTSSPWVGNTTTVEGIAKWGNIADRELKGFPSNAGAKDDNYVIHAPVGQYRANAFGLHDVLGNVWEWTAVPRINRGGSYLGAAYFARVAYSGGRAEGHRDAGLGLRPCRAVVVE